MHEEEERVLIDHIRSLQQKNKKFDMYDMTHIDSEDEDDNGNLDTLKKGNDQ